MVYIGENKRCLEDRIKEHRANVKYGRTRENSVTVHVWEMNHVIDWNKVKILNTDEDWIRRKAKEVCHGISGARST